MLFARTVSVGKRIGFHFRADTAFSDFHEHVYPESILRGHKYLDFVDVYRTVNVSVVGHS